MTNLSKIVVSHNENNSSPFEQIKRYDSQGNEYWSARELMPVMGYTTWQRFESPINQAIENFELNGDNISNHINAIANVVKRSHGGGSAQQDYKLSRYACYMVALCCDGRKSEVASAKKYFAIKTREAETIIPAQNEQLELAKLENENLKMRIHYFEKRKTFSEIHGLPALALIDGNPDAVVRQTEKVTESIITQNGRTVNFVGRSTADIGKELGFKTGKDLERWLEKIGHGDLVCEGLRINPAPYIPEEYLQKVRQVWAEYRTKSTRQMLLGE